jgi:hypothetical protein
MPIDRHADPRYNAVVVGARQARLRLPHQPRAGRLRVLTVGRPVEVDYGAKPRIRTEEFHQFLE